MILFPRIVSCTRATALLVVVFVGFLGRAEEQENATLDATVLSGALEIVASSIPDELQPVTGDGVTMGVEQVDAIVFRLEDITIKDLNGDGLGFRLTATPTDLFKEQILFASSFGDEDPFLPVGTIDGFFNSSDIANSSYVDSNTLLYTGNSGVVLSVDYQIRYTIPAFIDAGNYSGTLSLSVAAE